jgi:hypothetical protein
LSISTLSSLILPFVYTVHFTFNFTFFFHIYLPLFLYLTFILCPP